MPEGRSQALTAESNGDDGASAAADAPDCDLSAGDGDEGLESPEPEAGKQGLE